MNTVHASKKYSTHNNSTSQDVTNLFQIYKALKLKLSTLSKAGY